MDDGPWVVVVLEVGASTEDGRPRLTDYLHARRDAEGVSDNVDTSIEVDDLASGVLLRC